MTSQKPRLRRASLAAGAVIVTACAGVLFAAPADAAPTITFSEGVLTINGDAGRNGLTVGHTPAGIVTLNGKEVVVLGRTVPVADVQLVRMDGGAGDDILSFDETNGAMPPGNFDGGEGRDFLVGGSQDDTLIGGGGTGIDRAIGGPGDDTVTLGDGPDQFTWNPGDGNDTVDANAGTDTLIFNGSDRNPSDGGQDFETENLSFHSDGSRTTIRRDLTRQSPLPSELDVISFSGFEHVKTPLAGGPNSVFFADDFSGSDIAVVRVDLGPPGEAPRIPGTGLDTRSRAQFQGTEGADRIRVGGRPADGAFVSGLGPAVLLTGAQILTVIGEGGDDHIDAGGMAAGTVEVLQELGAEFANDGNDTLRGHPGHDELFGGAGDDRLEGRGGDDDILDGGTGIDIIIP
jgi:Ca2+-binding RTX toxin-like protein